MKKLINAKKSAEILGVSEATIKNWIKHKYLFPIEKKEGQYFDKSQIISLKNKIENGEITRLNSRANKRNSSKKFIPQKYFSEFKSDGEFLNSVNYIIDNSLSIEIAIFYLSINLLLKENFIYNKNIKKILEFKSKDFKNKYVLRILKNAFNKFNIIKLNNNYLGILNFNLSKHHDILGIIYQSVKSEGEKAKQGSYYTPQEIVKNIISEHIQKSSTVLDPCCGTGQFLLNINDKDINPHNIYGFDIDPIAVFICKINLLLKYKSLTFNPKIYQLNSLTEIEEFQVANKTVIPKDFDLIFTNPPWGSHYNGETKMVLKEKYSAIKSMESYSYFLLKGLSLLKPGGILSYILPESILNIKTHRDIRKIILSETNIQKIEKLGRVFTNVFTNVIRLDLKKSIEANQVVNIICKNSFTVKQKRFSENIDFIFDIDKNEIDAAIINRVFSKKHTTLKGNAEWALGIVTGNNKKFIRPNKTDGYEEIYKGKDVSCYNLSKATNFIKFEPEKFQQVAPTNKYRTDEKLIYKFICGKLVFAYDNQQKLTLNSANILIPNIKDYPIKVILALFNSSLFNFIYRKKFNSIKILRGNLEQLPLPIFNKKINSQIILLVDKALTDDLQIKIIDNMIFDLFEMNNSERNYIRESIM